ncbi:MAG: hypothetical protein QXG10_03995 [Candidatus Hadarchaeales archaeon]
MKNKKYLITAAILALIAVAAFILLAFGKMLPGENVSGGENDGNFPGGENVAEGAIFIFYEPVTVDFRHPDDIDPGILPPTPENVPVYDLMIKSYDFNPEKTGFVDETAADDENWCRIKQITPNMWAYYFEDYHYELKWENGERWNPDFNDVVVILWKTENAFRIRIKASISTFRNELWVAGEKMCENVAARADEVFEAETIPRLR